MDIIKGEQFFLEDNIWDEGECFCLYSECLCSVDVFYVECNQRT